jgi:hypothetical protein
VAESQKATDDPATDGTLENDVFSTPKALPENHKVRNNGFYGTSDADEHIGVAEERRHIVIPRIDPATKPENILRYVKDQTGIGDENCQLLLPKGRDLSDLKFVSFKLGVNDPNYQSLMTPNALPAKVLVRDFDPSFGSDF